MFRGELRTGILRGGGRLGAVDAVGGEFAVGAGFVVADFDVHDAVGGDGWEEG